MKIPKQIKINGNNWKIQIVKEDNFGGSFSYQDRLIKVEKGLDTVSVLLHEILEIIMVEQRIRYMNTTDNGYKFFFTHDDFTRLVEMLYAVLNDNKFLK